MRNTRKILVALLVLITILVSLVAVAIPAGAAAPEKLYLTPNANWKVDNARFAAYFFGNGEKWVSMTYNADLGLYEVDVPAGYPSVIFCRMNPNATANNWNNKWNQTADLTVPTNGNNHYTVKEGTWDKGGGTWGTLIIDSGECEHANVTTEEAAATCTTDGYKKVFCNDCQEYTVNESYPALGHTYSNGTDNECNVCSAAASWTVAGSGAHMGTEWDTGNKANDMTLVDGSYVKVYENVAAGSYALKVVRDHDWGTAYPSADKAYTVATAGSTVTVTLKGTTVTIDVVAPHVHSWSDATCTEPSKCSCGETNGEALGHVSVEFDPNNPSELWTLVDLEEGLDICECEYEPVYSHTCTGCGEYVFFANGYARGHVYTKWQPTVNNGLPECEWIPVEISQCDNCNCNDHFESRKVGSAKGHTWSDATCASPKTCSVCGATDGEALGHSWENCACTRCEIVLPTLSQNESFAFTTQEEFDEAVAGGKLAFVGSFRDNGGTFQFNTNSSIQFVAPANSTVTIVGHSEQYGVFNVSLNGEVTKMVGSLTFTVTEETKVVIATGDEGASYSYIKSITLNEYVDRTISTETTITFGSEGNYKTSIVDFSGIQIGDNGGNNSQVKNGSFDLVLLAGASVTIHGYPGYTSYKLNDGEEITDEYYTFTTDVDTVLTVTPVNGNNYFYSIEISYHTHVWSDATCTEPQKCECGETQGEALGHTAGAEPTCTVAQTCTVCGEELAAKLGHLDENLDTYCDREGCTGRPVPPTESHVSNFTANHLATISTSNMYYVEGVIVEVLDQRNGIFLIDDGTGETFYFRLPKDADGISHASWAIKLTLGDKVQVYGKINKYSTTTAPNGQYWPAIQSGVVTILEQHAHVAAGEPVCTKDTLCACGAVVAPATGHIDADNNSMCDNCPWDMNLVEVNIAIGTDAKYNGVVTNGDDGKALYWTWTAENFDAIIHKGTSTVTVYTTAKDYMQLKKQNTLTIVNKDDVTVKYIVISVTNATYLGYLKTALTDQYEYTADEENFTVTIQLNSSEDFVMENKASSTIYVNGVTIVYAKKGVHVHEFTETITTPATCTEAGVKTFACECGQGTYTEVIEALGHDFVKGVCSVCGAEDPNYVPPCEHKDTGLDAKCDVCGEWFLPSSPFKLEMYQASKQETYYFTGSMSGYYFATSTDINAAVDLYAEEVDGGYNVYFMSGSTKNYLYIELSGTHINAKFGSTQAVWYVDPTYGALVTELDGAKYFLGTYSSYVTFGGTAYTRLNDSTADISQYIGRAVSLEEHVCENTSATVTAPTCTSQGYTTYKCADCGLSTKADYVDALGHTAGAEATCTEAQTCTVCGEELVAALGHTAGAEATCTDAQTCTVCGAELVEALGHTAGDAATCTTAQTCTVCGEELVAALGHDMLTHTETLPTCTEAGVAAGEECFRCGQTTGLDEIAALGHDYAEGQCTRCGDKDPDYVAPHEHNFVEGKCECGETDPDYVPEEEPKEEDPKEEDPEEEPAPEVELSLIEQIMKTLSELIAMITAWLNSLLGGFKK